MFSSTAPKKAQGPTTEALTTGSGAESPRQHGDAVVRSRMVEQLFAREGAQPVDLASAVRGNGGRSPLHLHGGRHGVLLFHGLSSTAAELNYLARGLNRAGYTVRVPVIEGYSHRSVARKKNGHRDWLAAALQEFDDMRAQCSTVSVGGLCIGSLLALGVSAERPSLTSAILGLSTTLHYDGWANPWTRHLLPIFRYLPVGGGIRIREREPFGIKDERMRAFVAAQMRASGTSDAGAAQLTVRDLLEAQRLAGVVRRSLHAVTSPTLLIHAKEDECASPRSSFDVAKGVGSQHVRLVLLSNSYHMISIDRERARVLSEMKDFLAAHLGAQQPNDVERQSVSSAAPEGVGQARVA